jgi:tRNA pseudouridine38-40 synthase
MQLWKLTLAYDGTAFHGWQVQPHLPTVQGTLAYAIRQICGEDLLPQGSGRTDTGVHAMGQVASFELGVPIPPANFLRALNRKLPPSIRVLSAEHAGPGFHARHSALRKTYEYRLFPGKAQGGGASEEYICSPFVARYAWDCPWPFSLGRAQEAARLVVGEHNFVSFAASDPDLATRTSGEVPPTVRTIFQSEWRQEGELFVYRVMGSGFLHHMVRNLVGTFVDVAAGRLEPDSIARILALRDRSAASATAPAQGLFLIGVEYPI